MACVTHHTFCRWAPKQPHQAQTPQRHPSRRGQGRCRRGQRRYGRGQGCCGRGQGRCGRSQGRCGRGQGRAPGPQRPRALVRVRPGARAGARPGLARARAQTARNRGARAWGGQGCGCEPERAHTAGGARLEPKRPWARVRVRPQARVNPSWGLDSSGARPGLARAWAQAARTLGARAWGGQGCGCEPERACTARGARLGPSGQGHGCVCGQGHGRVCGQGPGGWTILERRPGPAECRAQRAQRARATKGRGARNPSLRGEGAPETEPGVQSAPRHAHTPMGGLPGSVTHWGGGVSHWAGVFELRWTN